MKVWKYKLIFPTYTLQQNIEISDLKPFLAAENTCTLVILATAVATTELLLHLSSKIYTLLLIMKKR